METETPAEKQQREDREKFNNLIFYKMYVTNEERDEAFSAIGGILFYLVPVILIAMYILHNGLHLKFLEWIHSFKF